MTKFIRRRARQSDRDSIKLTTVGPEGSLRVMGFVVADDNSFTSSIRFNDTKKTVQPNLYATNLRLKNAEPRIVLKNASDIAVSARPRFFTAKGEFDDPVELPAMTLAPQQIVEVDLSALRTAAASRTDLDSVSVQIENSGAPGSLIGAAYSSDNRTGLTYDVPLRDSGKVRNLTGSYPWRIDDDYSTVVSITNAGTQPARFQVEIRYPGGPYSIKPRQLEPGQTAVFDLRKMRDEEAPDRTGKALAVNRGQFHWSVVATPGEAHLIGRAEVISRSARVASSYSCPTCCPDSGPFGGFDPSSYTLAIDGSIATSSSGAYYDCYWNSYPTTMWFSSLSTWYPEVATFTEGTEDLHGEGAGFTWAVGTYDHIEWWTDNMDCYQYYYPAESDAPVDVECTKPSSETTSGVGWDNLDPTLYKYEQTLSASGVSFVGRTVTEQDPGGGGPDTCHFTNSAWDPFDKVNGSSWTVMSGNKWRYDFVGYHSGAVSYYRNQGRAPCGTTFQQRMVIDCSTGPLQYVVNTLSAAITSTTVSSTRAGNTAIKTWP
jgi:hypothetical protein